jgi:hypothetical protein
MQSQRPVVVGTAGIALLLVAASGDGPLRAFGHFSRGFHRTLDLSMVVGLFAASLVFWSDLGLVGVFVLFGTALALLVLVVQTDYREKVPRPARTAAPISSEDVGRRAGRMVGNGVRAWRDRRSQSSND